MFKLEMIPLLGMKEGAIWGYLNEPEEKTDQPKPSNLADLESDIPF